MLMFPFECLRLRIKASKAIQDTNQYYDFFEK